MKRYISSAKQASNSKVTLRCKYEIYMRYMSGGLKRIQCTGNSLLEALKKLVSKVGLYIDVEEIEEENMTAEEVLERIQEENGDGCDYITWLENVTTGEVYIDEDYDDEVI